MQIEQQKSWSDEDHYTWSQLFKRLDYCRKHQAHPLFMRGIEVLGFQDTEIPPLQSVNQRLNKLTGWQGVPVTGLEDHESFFRGLKERKFPIGNFIRSPEDLNYTPAPDVFHDLYGHIPFFADPDYADFNQKFGAIACNYIGDTEKIEKFSRLYWFGLEFPLIKTEAGNRIFGGGILSSFGESHFSLSHEPDVRDFSVHEIINLPYKIDEFQKTLFILQNEKQLYNCLEDFEKALLDA